MSAPTVFTVAVLAGVLGAIAMAEEPRLEVLIEFHDNTSPNWAPFRVSADEKWLVSTRQVPSSPPLLLVRYLSSGRFWEVPSGAPFAAGCYSAHSLTFTADGSGLRCGDAVLPLDPVEGPGEWKASPYPVDPADPLADAIPPFLGPASFDLDGPTVKASGVKAVPETELAIQLPDGRWVHADGRRVVDAVRAHLRELHRRMRAEFEQAAGGEAVKRLSGAEVDRLLDMMRRQAEGPLVPRLAHRLEFSPDGRWLSVEMIYPTSMRMTALVPMESKGAAAIPLASQIRGPVAWSCDSQTAYFVECVEEPDHRVRRVISRIRVPGATGSR